MSVTHSNKKYTSVLFLKENWDITFKNFIPRYWKNSNISRKCQIDKKLVHLSANFHFHRLPNILVLSNYYYSYSNLFVCCLWKKEDNNKTYISSTFLQYLWEAEYKSVQVTLHSGRIRRKRRDHEISQVLLSLTISPHFFVIYFSLFWICGWSWCSKNWCQWHFGSWTKWWNSQIHQNRSTSWQIQQFHQFF